MIKTKQNRKKEEIRKCERPECRKELGEEGKVLAKNRKYCSPKCRQAKAIENEQIRVEDLRRHIIAKSTASQEGINPMFTQRRGK